MQRSQPFSRARLRPARPEDAASLAAISIEVWLGTYIRHGVSTAFADHALSTFTAGNLRAMIERPGAWVLVSENDDGPDGFIRLTSGAPAPVPACSELEIATFYVQPRHQGHGKGRALLAAALRHARETGHASVWLTTNSENAPAIGFYLSQGFEKIGTTHFRIGAEAYPNDVYRLLFPPAGPV
ncbi:MAG: N-acetyltransferase [Rhodobacteraceae bacterium]|jgi:ribosomal protein S18 acetylase RimI-like enzyme|uniref:Acetyltransferase n=1 Tax=Salipiger profundus TaxID=1229727 RepID=A0A1U7DAN1_9RHOB|nr:MULTISPECIES: GNAT family N-acetyltransferase [Salipiger]APX25120.1 acetyltransferase [Salipiger profundus]MAB05460.1 N-acetyltransferase [Paracoccaceae bacterium]GGA15451.1 N-acetyltransferase [Salipiger profundus]SFD10315.1 Ribosomal protein S18 acetylase RimI [Salipiger profundus]